MSRLKGTSYVFAIAFVASVGGFLFGYDLAIMGGANVFLKEQFGLSDRGFGFTNASAILGCAAGPFLGAWLCDRFGRRRTLIGASYLLALGAVLTALPRDIYTFNVFRIVGGVGVGLCSIASPMYIAEVAPPRSRGGLGFMYQLAIVTGMVVSCLVAYCFAGWFPVDNELALDVRFRNGRHSDLRRLSLCGARDSARWLAARGMEPQALAVLERIGGAEYADQQMREIRKSLSAETGTWRELMEPGMRQALAVGILLAIFNNYTGWSGIYNYLTTLFKQAGYETKDAILQYMLSYAFMGVMTLAACFVVDRVGRRPLWIGGAALMIVANMLTGWLFHVHAAGFIVLLAIFLMAIPHSFALGPLPWLMMSELYPTRIRARAVSITTTVLWAASFLPVLLFPIAEAWSKERLGSVAGVFWIYAGICGLALLFGWTMLPETKGRSLEEIADSWKRG